jgi:uncharacterized protein YbjT (DUF2867 family)
MRTQTVAILGANGVYARHLIPRLVAAGQRVRALVRRPEAAGLARACGAEIRVADIFDEEALCAALVGCDLGVNLATSLPGPSGRGDFAINDRLRRDGTPIWLRACHRAQVPRVIQQSIAMVNAAGGDVWCDEDTVTTQVHDELAARAIEAALAMEASVRCSGIECLILRGGLFYGPGTGFDDDWFARSRAGRLRLPGAGEDCALCEITYSTLGKRPAWRACEARLGLPVSELHRDEPPAEWGLDRAQLPCVLLQEGFRKGRPSQRRCSRKATLLRARAGSMSSSGGSAKPLPHQDID